jgi:hypothetical protein
LIHAEHIRGSLLQGTQALKQNTVQGIEDYTQLAETIFSYGTGIFRITN